jgi:hypothetical protein
VCDGVAEGAARRFARAKQARRAWAARQAAADAAFGARRQQKQARVEARQAAAREAEEEQEAAAAGGRTLSMAAAVMHACTHARMIITEALAEIPLRLWRWCMHGRTDACACARVRWQLSPADRSPVPCRGSSTARPPT